MNNMISVFEFEDKVFSLEGIRVVIRASKDALVMDYTFDRKEPAKTRINTWLKRRILPRVNDFDVVVTSGYGVPLKANSCVETLRNSYPDLPEKY